MLNVYTFMYCLFWVDLRTSNKIYECHHNKPHIQWSHVLCPDQCMFPLSLALSLSVARSCSQCFLSLVLFSGSLHIAHMEMTIKYEQWQMRHSSSLHPESLDLYAIAGFYFGATQNAPDNGIQCIFEMISPQQSQCLNQQ